MASAPVHRGAGTALRAQNAAQREKEDEEYTQLVQLQGEQCNQHPRAMRSVSHRYDIEWLRAERIERSEHTASAPAAGGGVRASDAPEGALASGSALEEHQSLDVMRWSEESMWRSST